MQTSKEMVPGGSTFLSDAEIDRKNLSLVIIRMYASMLAIFSLSLGWAPPTPRVPVGLQPAWGRNC